MTTNFVKGVLLIQTINPFTFAVNIISEYNIPVHLLLIGSAVKNRLQIPTEILDLRELILPPINHNNYQIYEDTLQRKLIEYKEHFNVYAISVYSSSDYIPALSIAKLLKQNDPQNVVIVGGFHPSYKPEDFFQAPNHIDFIIQGEADIAFMKLIQDLNTNGWHSKQDPVVISADPILDLNTLHDIDWSLYPLDKIPKQIRIQVPIYGSRGCPFECSFCVTHALNQNMGKNVWRSYDFHRILKQIEQIEEYFGSRPHNLFFYDPLFGLKAEWRESMLRALIEHYPDTPFSIELRIDTFREREVNLFSKLHANLNFGLESGDPTMLSIMNKTKNPSLYLSRMQEIVEHCEQHNIYWHTNLICGHPGETPETLHNSLRYVDNLYENRHFGFLFLKNFILFPGSPVYNNRPAYEKQYGTDFFLPLWYKVPYPGPSIYFVHPSRGYTFDQITAELNEWGERFFSTLEHNLRMDPLHFGTEFTEFFQSLNYLKQNPELRKTILRQDIPKKETLNSMTKTFWQQFFGNLPKDLKEI
jgi:radical SAM superfamily enzyme YgiQ (UPF0313 family)